MGRLSLYILFFAGPLDMPYFLRFKELWLILVMQNLVEKELLLYNHNSLQSLVDLQTYPFLNFHTQFLFLLSRRLEPI
jgi:hypothetical protein